MPRTAATPTTALGLAIQRRRAADSGRGAAPALGLSPAALYAFENGTRRPNMSSSLALAQWLGWPLDRVARAATQRPEALDAQDQDTAAPVVESPPESVATTPAPVSTVAQALRLPDGRILRPWRVGHIDGKPAYERVQLGGLASIRANLKQVAADDVPQPQQAIVRSATSLEHLREIVDRWLITNGATAIDP